MEVKNIDITSSCFSSPSFCKFISYKDRIETTTRIVLIENERTILYKRMPFFHWLSNMNIRKRLIMMSWFSMFTFLMFICSSLTLFSGGILNWLIMGLALLLFYTTFQLHLADINYFHVYKITINESISGYVLHRNARQPLGIINEEFSRSEKKKIERELFSHIRFIDFIIRLIKNFRYQWRHYFQITNLVIFRRDIVPLSNNYDTLCEIDNNIKKIKTGQILSLYSIHKQELLKTKNYVYHFCNYCRSCSIGTSGRSINPAMD